MRAGTKCKLVCRFVMWYEAVAQDGSRSIGVAVSSNGISDWRRRDRQAFSGLLTALSSKHVHAFSFVAAAVSMPCLHHCMCALCVSNNKLSMSCVSVGIKS